MKAVRMIAKRAGTCTACGRAVEPGQRILWARGSGARHADCAAPFPRMQCPNCRGAGADFMNRPCKACETRGYIDRNPTPCESCGGRGVCGYDMPCGRCDGSGRQPVEPTPAAGQPDRFDTDYEDRCRDACGL